MILYNFLVNELQATDDIQIVLHSFLQPFPESTKDYRSYFYIKFSILKYVNYNVLLLDSWYIKLHYGLIWVQICCIIL